MKRSANPKCYEEGHFISLQLGGDPKNLCPEPYNPVPGAKEKDWVENYLRRQVCAGSMTLKDAQRAIVTDWYARLPDERPVTGDNRRSARRWHSIVAPNGRR